MKEFEFKEIPKNLASYNYLVVGFLTFSLILNRFFKINLFKSMMFGFYICFAGLGHLIMFDRGKKINLNLLNSREKIGLMMIQWSYNNICTSTYPQNIANIVNSMNIRSLLLSYSMTSYINEVIDSNEYAHVFLRESTKGIKLDYYMEMLNNLSIYVLKSVDLRTSSCLFAYMLMHSSLEYDPSIQFTEEDKERALISERIFADSIISVDFQNEFMESLLYYKTIYKIALTFNCKNTHCSNSSRFTYILKLMVESRFVSPILFLSKAEEFKNKHLFKAMTNCIEKSVPHLFAVANIKLKVEQKVKCEFPMISTSTINFYYKFNISCKNDNLIFNIKEQHRNCFDQMFVCLKSGKSIEFNGNTLTLSCEKFVMFASKVQDFIDVLPEGDAHNNMYQLLCSYSNEYTRTIMIEIKTLLQQTTKGFANERYNRENFDSLVSRIEEKIFDANKLILRSKQNIAKGYPKGKVKSYVESNTARSTLLSELKLKIAKLKSDYNCGETSYDKIVELVDFEHIKNNLLMSDALMYAQKSSEILKTLEKHFSELVDVDNQVSAMISALKRNIKKEESTIYSIHQLKDEEKAKLEALESEARELDNQQKVKDLEEKETRHMMNEDRAARILMFREQRAEIREQKEIESKRQDRLRQIRQGKMEETYESISPDRFDAKPLLFKKKPKEYRLSEVLVSTDSAFGPNAILNDIRELTDIEKNSDVNPLFIKYALLGALSSFMEELKKQDYGYNKNLSPTFAYSFRNMLFHSNTIHELPLEEVLNVATEILLLASSKDYNPKLDLSKFTEFHKKNMDNINPSSSVSQYNKLVDDCHIVYQEYNGKDGALNTDNLGAKYSFEYLRARIDSFLASIRDNDDSVFAKALVNSVKDKFGKNFTKIAKKFRHGDRKLVGL